MVDVKRYIPNGYGTCIEMLKTQLISYPTSNHNAGFRANTSLWSRSLFSFFQPIKYHKCNACINSPFYVNYDIVICKYSIDVKTVKERDSFHSHDKKIEYNELFKTHGSSKNSNMCKPKAQEIKLVLFKKASNYFLNLFTSREDGAISDSFISTFYCPYIFTPSPLKGIYFVRNRNGAFGDVEVKVPNSLTRILFIPQRNISLNSYRLSYNRVN